MASALEEFQEFEKQADLKIASLSIWQLPIRTILSMVYLAADGQFVGVRFDRQRPRNEEVATAMLSRLSYVAPFLSKSARDIGENIDDALSVADVQFAADVEQVLGYAHFCEVMPHVWRGFLSVERRASGFVLKHPHSDFAMHEENDTLMSEMVLPHELRRPPHPIESCKRIVKTLPAIPADAMIEALRGAYDHYLTNVSELALLSDQAFREAFGVPRADFIRLRAGLMAYADFCLGMADAAEMLSAKAFTRPKRELLQREVREWAAPLLLRNHVISVVARLSGAHPDIAERIVDLYTLDPSDVDRSGVGEGYLPPFLRLQESLLFSPHAVKRMMPERNLLYVMARTNRRMFDDIVSRHLEPELVAQAAELLSALPGVAIRKNVKWGRGEIDLIAFHEASNSALQIQAKAGVPPEGARMIAQVESRTLEAGDQLERFLGLPVAEKDAICSSAFGKNLSEVSWSSGILMRTCLGTEKAWSRIKGFAPLNPVLLKVAVKRMSKEEGFSFVHFGEVVEQELARFRSVAIAGWDTGTFALFGEEVTLPLLRLNAPAVSDFRLRASN